MRERRSRRTGGHAPAINASLGLHALAAAAALTVPAAWPWALAAVAADHLVLGAAGMMPHSTLLGPNLRRLPPGGAPVVALTFDDGPDPAVTPRILALLAAAGARASFFCIGQRARTRPDLVRAIVGEGHQVENHTDSHSLAFAALPPGLLRGEVGRAQETLAGLTGRAPGYFRPPGGLRSPLLEPVLRRERLRLASWTRRALDGVRGDGEAALARLSRDLAAGDILLLHDGNAARTRGGEAVALAVLPPLLERLRRAGLAAVPLAEALGD